MLTAGLLPEPLEDQSRTDTTAGVGREFPLGIVCEDPNRLGQAGTGNEQSVKLSTARSSSSRPKVAMTRWRERPPSQRFSTTWR